jgi:hypothetical protein
MTFMLHVPASGTSSHMPVGTPPISSTRKAAQGENSEAADTPPIVSAGGDWSPGSSSPGCLDIRLPRYKSDRQ